MCTVISLARPQIALLTISSCSEAECRLIDPLPTQKVDPVYFKVQLSCHRQCCSAPVLDVTRRCASPCTPNRDVRYSRTGKYVPDFFRQINTSKCNNTAAKSRSRTPARFVQNEAPNAHSARAPSALSSSKASIPASRRRAPFAPPRSVGDDSGLSRDVGGPSDRYRVRQTSAGRVRDDGEFRRASAAATARRSLPLARHPVGVSSKAPSARFSHLISIIRVADASGKAGIVPSRPDAAI